MESKLRKVMGFRSAVPWKSGIALIYYLLCFSFFCIAAVTPPLIPAGARDSAVFKLSSLVLLVWMLSPSLFLSETKLRSRLPFFKDRQGLRSLAGLMIVSLIFLYLFMTVEALHTPLYKAEFTQFINTSFEMFVQAGGPA